MNVAPALLYPLGFDVKLLDAVYYGRVAQRLALAPVMAPTEVPLLRIHDWSVLRPDHPLPVGLFTLSRGAWDTAVSQVRVIKQTDSTNHGLALRATPISDDRMLLFPDDPSNDTLTFRVFAPTVVKENLIVLNVIGGEADSEGRLISSPTIAASGGCTQSIEGEIGKRRFSCSRSGCHRNCEEEVRSIEGDTHTFLCRC